MPFAFTYSNYLELLVRLRLSIRRRITEDLPKFEEITESDRLLDVQRSPMWADFHRVICTLTYNQLENVDDIVLKIMNELVICGRSLFFVKSALGSALTEEMVADALCMTIGFGLHRSIYPSICVEGRQQED